MKKLTAETESSESSVIQVDTQAHKPLQALNRDAIILLVEDSPFNSAYIRRFIHKIGCRCKSYDNGTDALDAFKEVHFDAVLMDLSLPQMDGFETVRRIRDHERLESRVPIIALTAHRSNKVKERCLASGFDEYIEKPVRPHALRQVLASVLKMD